MMVKVRNMFPGGNTCHGFYSFYEYIVPPHARRKIVLKGGPGVGKSTLMKKIAGYFVEKGYDVEFHWCSSDNASLDAFVLTDWDIAILDGTAPHVVDPRYPGVVDEIINLGEFWDENRLRPLREEIITAIDLNSRYFALAYSRLKEAKVIYDEWASYYERAIDPQAVNDSIRTLLTHVFGQSPANPDIIGQHSSRHLFSSAITPQGVVTHLPSLIDKDYALYVVKGNPGTGVERVISAVSMMAEHFGMRVQYYHNPFVPEQLETVVLPGIPAAVVDISGWVVDSITALADRPISIVTNMDDLVDPSRLRRFSGEIEGARQRFTDSLAGAVAHIRNAKLVHDRLESNYVRAMNFSRLDKKGVEIYERILEYLV